MALTKGIVAGGNYTFSAANQTITFSSDYLGMSLSDVTYITNIKSGVATVIYDPFDPLKGGTLSGLVLTLAYNTVAMADDDPLQIIVGFTPNNATPQNVNITPNTQLDSQTELLQSIAESTNLLAASVDGTEGIQVNVRDIGTKKDIQGANIPSDAPVPINFTFARLNDQYIFDTTGYQHISINGVPSAANLQVSFQGKNNDGSAWHDVPAIVITSGFPATTVTFGSAASWTSPHTWYIPCVTKFIRIFVSSYTSGLVSYTAYLRQFPLPTGPFTQIPVSATTNITQYNGTTAATAQQIDAAGNLASAGNFAIGSSYVATSNRPNAASVLATGVPYPHAIGGREQPYIGALAGIYRHITVDGGGRYILGGDTPDTETRFQSKLASGAIPGIPPRGIGAKSNTMMGSQALLVQDVDQSEGDTNTMLLKQILQELKILNQQIIEIPFLLNMGENTMSDPQEYRDDKSTLF